VTEPAFSLNGPVVVRSPNWLGDAVIALPAVRNLKTMLVNDPLTVAAPDKLAALWQACPFVDKVIALERPKSIFATARQLREGNFGSAVLLPNSLRTAAEARLAGISQRIGYMKDGRRFLLTKALPVPPRNPIRLHQRFYYLDLITALGGPEDPSMPALRKDSPAMSAGSPPIIALCPGAEYGPAKRWPAENFLAVAKHFAEKYRAKIVLLGAAGDAAIAEAIAKQLPEAENRVGKTTLVEFMTALASAKLVVCNDSGAMHVASALGVPTATIFGSTEPLLTGPLGPHTQVLRHHVPCSPCFLRECPIDFACMKKITPEMVIAAGEVLLK
jgi:heptosyltransferase-2